MIYISNCKFSCFETFLLKNNYVCERESEFVSKWMLLVEVILIHFKIN